MTKSRDEERLELIQALMEAALAFVRRTSEGEVSDRDLAVRSALLMINLGAAAMANVAANVARIDGGDGGMTGVLDEVVQSVRQAFADGSPPRDFLAEVSEYALAQISRGVGVRGVTPPRGVSGVMVSVTRLPKKGLPS